MAKGKGASPKGLGQKYRLKLRKKFTAVHGLLTSERRCPDCGSIQFGREAVGIWVCKKCGFKIAGMAYDVKL